MNPKRKAIFLDRDGTLIVERNYLNDAELVEMMPGSIACLRELRDLGFEFCIVTNQSGLISGRVHSHNLEAIHAKIRRILGEAGIDVVAIYVAQAPSGADDFMRKPSPGMLLTAAEEYRIDLAQSWMIGDKPIDVEAGRRAGCRTIFFKQPHSSAFRFEQGFASPHFECHNWEQILNAIKEQAIDAHRAI